MRLTCKLFDLNQTLCCGQVFRWKLEEDQWWYGVIRDYVLKIRQIQNDLEFDIFPQIENPGEFISRYFRLDDNLELIYGQISKDDYLKDAIHNAHGLRLIRQDPWECMISFMISQNNQIPKIKHSIETLAHKYGNLLHCDGREFYTFPTPAQLSDAKITDLKDPFNKGGCALGYRGKYVLSAALMSHKNSLNFSLEEIKKMPYEEASALLQDSFCGIGPKVADCILLFSMEKLEAVPLDTWIRKIILNCYFDNKEIPDRKIREFLSEYFGKYAGYAQQYLYCNRVKLCQQI